MVLGRLDESGELLPALLAGGRPLDELFEATLPQEDPDGVGLVLRPRAAEDRLERIELAIRAEDGAIERATVFDAGGQHVELRLTRMRRNGTLAPSAFVFTPPEGTLVSGSHESVEGPSSR
jgi:outer membrane lipoprotein-sorting protein